MFIYCFVYESNIFLQFLRQNLKSVVEVQRHGGARLQVGQGTSARTETFFPLLMCVVTDNQGAHSCIGCMATGCAHPCRLCTSTSQQTLFDEIVPLRDPNLTLNMQEVAWRAFGKKIRKEERTVEEDTALKWCGKNSIHPIPSALLALKKPYVGHNAFLYVPPDILHTVLAGIMRNWIFWTITILERVG